MGYKSIWNGKRIFVKIVCCITCFKKHKIWKKKNKIGMQLTYFNCKISLFRLNFAVPGIKFYFIFFLNILQIITLTCPRVNTKWLTPTHTFVTWYWYKKKPIKFQLIWILYPVLEKIVLLYLSQFMYFVIFFGGI